MAPLISTHLYFYLHPPTESATPPSVHRALYLVLDEADRLLSPGFSTELQVILKAMHPQRKTLLFSATLTQSLVELEKIAGKETLRFDLTGGGWVDGEGEGEGKVQRMPERLLQQYLFMPAQVSQSNSQPVARQLASQSRIFCSCRCPM